MADADRNRQQTPQNPPAGMLKRHRAENELPPSGAPSANERQNYLSQDSDRGGPGALKDTKSIGSAYDRYLQNAQFCSLIPGEANNLTGAGLGRAVAGVHGFQPADPVLMCCPEVVDEGMGLVGQFPVEAPDGRGLGCDGGIPMDTLNGRGMGFVGRLPVDAMPRRGRETLPLPPDASSTLYVEGLPPDCRKREVAHIFRPFVGYKEVRLVNKESRHRGEPLVLCFVDFISPACAATAMSALQGYNMDEHDFDSPYLRIQFARYPGRRSGSFGKR